MRVTYPYNDNNVKTDLGQTNSFGVYPINRYNTWHGGLHIEGSKEIRAIADGRIIAYRIPEKYIEEILDEQSYHYSNGFMLIQHNYESLNKQKYTFYSLYNHLMSKAEMVAKNKVPDFYAKPIYKIKAKNHIKGLNARASEDFNKKVIVIPKGHTAIRDMSFTEAEKAKTHWRHQPKYKKYVKIYYCNPISNETINNIYIHSSYATLKDNTYTITTEDDLDKESDTGAIVYDQPNGKRAFQRIIKTGESIEVEKSEGSWYKLKETNEYVRKRDVSFTNEIKDDVTLDKIVNCDVIIKAGTIIGHTGKYGVEKQPNYRTAHLEIFSHQDPNPLLTDAKNDGEKKKNHFRLKEGAILKKNLKFDTSLKKNTPVKILEVKAEYSKVQVDDVIKVSKRSYLTNYKKADNRSYEILDAHFDTVNATFDGFISKGEKLYLIKQLIGDERKLRYKFADSGKIFWIKTEAIKQPQAVTTSPKRSFLPDNVASTGTGTDTIEEPVLVIPAKDTVVPINKAVSEYYLTELIEDTEDDTVIKEQILAIRELKKITDPDKKNWYYISLKDAEESKNGWIAENNTKLQKISAFDWSLFGFEALDAGNEFVYTVKDIMEATKTAAFIDTVWGKVDANQDKILDHNEWRNAYKRVEVVSKFSKLVCKHKNEWSYTADEVKTEIEQFFDIGIKLEEDDEKKQILEDKKQARLEALEKRIEHLCFWKEIKDGEVAEVKKSPKKAHRFALGENGQPLSKENCPAEEMPKEEKSKRTFPVNNDTVWHFHPIAFVNHMKLITAPTTPPWLEVALAEAKAAKFIEEWDEPTVKMVKKYHNYCNHFDNPASTDYVEDIEDAWCSSFVNWCLGQTDYKGIKSPASQSVLWQEGKLFKRIEEPEYGCIVLFTNFVKSDGHQSAKGHITFLYGKDSNGDLICLGGNQGQRIKFSRYFEDKNKVNSTFKQRVKGYGKVLVEQKFQGFFLPKSYPENNGKELQIVNLKKLNDQLAGKAVKSDTKNESTL